MFNDVLKEVTGIVDRRFLLNAFFPCLFFWGLLGIVLALGSGWETAKLLQIWNQQDITLKTLQIIGLITLVTFSASILTSQAFAILRFYEGYWNFPGGRLLRQVGNDWHQTQLDQLDVPTRLDILNRQIQERQHQLSSAKTWGLQQWHRRRSSRLEHQLERVEREQNQLQQINYEAYPQPKHRQEIVPTRLGNILKSAELYPYDRYQIDAVLVWSRLYHVLPDRFVKIITESRNNLDFALAISTLSGLFSLISGILLSIVNAPGWLFLLCCWSGSLIAWLAYQSAIGNAAAYAEQIRVSFDLYRHELVKQLRLKPAQKPEEEVKQWLEIRQLFYGGQVPSTWTYLEPEAKKKDESHNG